MYYSDCKEGGAQENHPIKLFMSSWAHPELSNVDIILTRSSRYVKMGIRKFPYCRLWSSGETAWDPYGHGVAQQGQIRRAQWRLWKHNWYWNSQKAGRNLESKLKLVESLKAIFKIVPKIVHIVACKTNLRKLITIEITLSMFYGHNGISLEINNRSIAGKSPNIWKLNNIIYCHKGSLKEN